ncbi:MAG: hypothetical protein JRH16_04015 [Deltaproteobacteria bacterium]|nr:hypothetical protein [Deltaproteobacteria bacterium]MBW2359715.1 hypothetical protein [Deltaproteobacteria bacterium]
MNERSAEAFGPAELALLFVACVGLALVLYRPALHGPFVSDDLHYVAQNRRVHDLSLENLKALADPRGAVAIDVVNYAPLQMLGHALAWRAFGPETFGHHVVNVVLHVISAMLLSWLLVTTGVPRSAALVAGAIFLVHPANVEAVAWVSQLKSALALPLAIGALLALPRRAWLATWLFAAALLAKATAVCVLPAAALLEWSRTGRVRAPWLVAWLVCFAVYAVVEFGMHQRTGAADAALYGTPFVLLRTVAALGARYAVLAVSGWPTSTFHEPEPAFSLLDPWWLLALPLLGIALWRVAAALRARSAEAAYWVWAAVAFAPISQVFPFLYPFADRYLYFILPGLLGAVLLAGQRVLVQSPAAHRQALARVGLLVGLVLIVGFAARTPGRAAVWRSNTALLLDAAEHYPDGKVASVLEAKRAARVGDVQTAIAALRRAVSRGFNRFEQLETDPSYAPIREAPQFRALVAELASTWIESAREKRGLTPSELRSVAHAHIARGEPEQALSLLDAAGVRGGPYAAEFEAEARAIRAGLAIGEPGRIRLRANGPR